MATPTSTSTGLRGRVRGLVLVWEGQQKQQLQINKHLPGCGRAETLNVLVDQRPEDRQWTQSQKEETCHMESTRTKWRQAIPCLEEPPERQPVLQPICLGQGIGIAPSVEPSSPMVLDYPPSPVPYSSSSSDSSRSPLPRILTSLFKELSHFLDISFLTFLILQFFGFIHFNDNTNNFVLRLSLFPI